MWRCEFCRKSWLNYIEIILATAIKYLLSYQNFAFLWNSNFIHKLYNEQQLFMNLWCYKLHAHSSFLSLNPLQPSDQVFMIALQKTKLIYCLHNISSKNEILIFFLWVFSLFLSKKFNFMKKHSRSLCNENTEDFSYTNEKYWRRKHPQSTSD